MKNKTEIAMARACPVCQRGGKFLRQKGFAAFPFCNRKISRQPF